MSARSLMAAALADELEARGIAALGLTLCEEIIEAVIESAAGACNRLSAREPSAREPNMLRIIDKASADPVSLAEAKAQLRVTDSSNDVLIKALIPAATNFVQSLVQRVFVSQTLEWVLPCWRDELGIPIAPVTKDDVASIKYVDWATQSQKTLDPSLYVVQTRGDSVAIFPKFGTIWPLVFSFSPEPIVIQFDAGYDDPSDLPGNVKAAILLQLRHLYSMGEVNLTLRKDTVFGLGEKQFQLTPEITTLIPDVVKNLVLDQVW